MVRILQSLLALISLLLLALMAARANSASWQESAATGNSIPPEPAISAGPRGAAGPALLGSGPQPGSHFQGQPFAYGYFGAKARPTAVFHRSENGDWYQWSIRRAD